jgi:hypothetical protein
MKLLLTCLLTLIPITVFAESRGGHVVGHRTAPSASGLIAFGMQGVESRMPESRLPRFGGVRGRASWPMIGYAQSPNLTIINVHVEGQEQPQPSPPKPPAPAKFWTARCGVFVELQVGPTMNLMEEERKSCAE